MERFEQPWHRAGVQSPSLEGFKSSVDVLGAWDSTLGSVLSEGFSHPNKLVFLWFSVGLMQSLSFQTFALSFRMPTTAFPSWTVKQPCSLSTMDTEVTASALLCPVLQGDPAGLSMPAGASICC